MIDDLDLLAEWLVLSSVSDEGLDRLGIDRRIANRAGGLAWANITSAGRGFDFDPSGIPTIKQGVCVRMTGDLACHA